MDSYPYEERAINPIDLRKEASGKTHHSNLNTYENINWNKVNTEELFAKAGILSNAQLPVIRSDETLLPVWDLKRYEFLLKQNLQDTVNPKIWLQGVLNLNAGLFQISDNIYQIRGFDAANMTLVRGRTGWVIIDCLTCKETAEAALRFAMSYFKEITVSAVIITHSHTDHYGGIAGVLEYMRNDGIIYAPQNFVNSVITENVTVGVAMARRSIYMYGPALPHDDKGQIDIGIGKGISTGTVTFTRDVQEITQTYTRIDVDGIPMEFLLALDTEAPSEMFTYIPGENALCIAEDCNATLHNLLTLRGAKVRDPVAWAKSIQKAIDLWGKDFTSVFGVHNWPRFGNQACIDYLEKQRDCYQYLNDQTLRLINKGYSIEYVGRMVKFPDSLAEEWYNGQFYGTVIHNAKAVYQRYLGWYNSNPVDLNKLLPEVSAKKYVEYMGGEDCVIEKAKLSFREGEYQWVAEVMKQVIYANPSNREAKLLCADALEQLGYVAESGAWRNEYLMGAQELRYGILPSRDGIITKDVMDNLPLGDILNLFSIRLDGIKAGDCNFKINFIIPDRQEAASGELKRGIFRYLNDCLAVDAAVTVTMSKEILYELASTNHEPDYQRIKIEGDADYWYLFLSLMDSINLAFPIMTPIEE